MNTLAMWGLYSFFVMTGFVTFTLNRKHLLSMLLSLEYIMLMVFLFLFSLLSFMEYEMYFSLMFLTFSVCEGALGVSILVSMVRSHGNDYFQSFNVI